MPPEATPPRRLGARLAAAATIGLLAAGAVAAPASAAEVPGLDEVHPDWHVPTSVRSGGESDGTFILDMVPSAGHEDDFNTVTFDLTLDDPAGLLDIVPGSGCEVDDSGSVLACEELVNGDFYFLDFDLVSTAAISAAVPVDYSLVIAIDGVDIVTETGSIDVIPEGGTNPYYPYLHSDPAPISGIAPGSSVEVHPVFKQVENLYSEAAAVVATFTDSYARMGIDLEGAEAAAAYDNCGPNDDSVRGGVVCVITDLTDRTGQALTFTGPITYAVGADALGPLQICHCDFRVETVNAQVLSSEFGHIEWDPASENLLGIEPAASWTEPVDPESAEYFGTVSITTSANPADLTVTGAVLEGYTGAKDSATVTVSNNGPATVYNRSDDQGDIAIRAQLPEGTTVAALPVSGSGWYCLGKNSLASRYSEAITTLDRFDLYCYLLTPLAAGESVDFTFTANLVDDLGGVGKIEVATLTTGPNGESLESTLGNNTGTIENLAEEPPAPEIQPRNDYNGDGRDDLLAVRASDGSLMFYAGKGDGTFAAGVAKGTGWGRMDVAMAGDLTGDGKADLLARDTKTGILYTYPGLGSGGVGARITIGTGWNAMGPFTSAADYNADGKADLLTVGRADGKLYFYPGQGNGKFGTRAAIGTGWGAMDTLASAGDLNADGKADLLAHDSRTGQYYLYSGDGTGKFSGRVAVAASLDATGSDRYDQIAAVGDFDDDRKEDFVAVDARTGELELHSLNGNGTAVHEGRVIATGWGGNRLAAVNEERTYDYDGNGTSDWIARRASDGTLRFYPGNGSAGHGTSTQMGTGWAGMGIVSTAGDMNGDGFADLLARKDSTGELFLYPGDGKGGYVNSARVLIGSGWNAMGTAIGGHDHNSDGKADLIAVEAATGKLYLYPGKGDGTLGSRITIGSSGWNAMREVTAVGDLDHDGHADLLAIGKSDGCLYFYGGTGTGTLKARVKVGCGWNAMDAITGVGDFNRDGHVDWLARRKSDGSLFLYPGNGAGNHTASKSIGTGWNAMNAIA